MNVYDILSDSEREAINAAMQELELPPHTALIVEEDDVTREMLAKTLQVNGIQCLMATNAIEALSLLETDKSIGLVITDLCIQPLHGLALIRKIRKTESADLPIVIVSGGAEVPDVIAAMHLNVIDFLLKPIDPDQLITLVSRELGIKSSRA
ncbi:C4-dicarboxylate transport transcriptional regulatory protein DctD [compost metagenome]